MSTDVKSEAPEPVAVTEAGTNNVVHPGDKANEAVRVNIVAGAGPSGGPSAAFDAAFPASGFAAGAKATAVAPTYGEGNMVALSVDLAGTLRTTSGGGGGGGLTDAQLRASPVPVSGPLTDTQLRASAVPVSNASLPLPSGASTEATLALIKAKTDNLDVLLSTRTKPADTQKVDGSAVTQPVSGTFWQATQPVSGPLTDAQLRASAVPVSGPLTDAQLRASAVPVSAAALPLPAGAATSANQATEIASLASIDTKLTNPLPVSVASLPIPVGAATAAKQDTGNTSLGSIDTKLVTYADGAAEGTGTGMLGMALSGDSPPVRIDGNVYPLSVTNDGRLRVSVVEARIGVEFFSGAELQMWDANDQRYWGGYSPNFTHTGNPFIDW